MKAPLLHLLLLALVFLAIFTTATQTRAEPGCIRDDCNVIPSGALPMAQQHRKLLKHQIEGGSGFKAPGFGGLYGDMTSTIGAGSGSNAWNYLPKRLGSWEKFADFVNDRSG